MGRDESGGDEQGPVAGIVAGIFCYPTLTNSTFAYQWLIFVRTSPLSSWFSLRRQSIERVVKDIEVEENRQITVMIRRNPKPLAV